ncbi:unnamed protein product [Cylindrotheca closterium]|uniref:Copper transporter n=1 Tax=Cylindrotheca closterium TaxID=2856 RepID=A0AAD2CEH0_9STRA|nr:unnamed protein product [Cylindrotheca closterium]
MIFRKKLSLCALLAINLLAAPGVLADDGGNDDANNNNNNNNNGDDAANGDDAYQKYFANNGQKNWDGFGAGNDNIQYWTDYAIYPDRCIVSNNVDVVVFTFHEQRYKQCSDKPMGTYITPVSNFLEGYLQYYQQIQQDKGNDDYALPDVAQYAYCTQKYVNGEEYWLQIGCSDTDRHSIAVNIYTDNTCTKRSTVDGLDDANIDVSEIQIPFKKCQACVMWVDKSDDQIDDMFFENRQTNAPLCSTSWNYKKTCNRRCRNIGQDRDGWSTPDKILLTILGLFGAGMLFTIVRRREKMSNKDALLEQAAMNAAGLQQSHVIGLFILYILVVIIFALQVMKNITWAMLLIMNTALFGYLMKLTIDSGVGQGETVIGPDGTIIRHADSDDSSTDSQPPTPNANAGTFEPAQLPEIA